MLPSKCHNKILEILNHYSDFSLTKVTMSTQEIIRNVEELSLRDIRDLIDNEGGRLEPRKRLEELLPKFLPRLFNFYSTTFNLTPREERYDIPKANFTGSSRVQSLEKPFIDQICKEIEDELTSEMLDSHNYLVRSSIMIVVDFIHRYFHVDKSPLDENIADELKKIRKVSTDGIDEYIQEFVDARKGDHLYGAIQCCASHITERLLNEILERYNLVPRE